MDRKQDAEPSITSPPLSQQDQGQWAEKILKRLNEVSSLSRDEMLAVLWPSYSVYLQLRRSGESGMAMRFALKLKEMGGSLPTARDVRSLLAMLQKMEADGLIRRCATKRAWTLASRPVEVVFRHYRSSWHEVTLPIDFDQRVSQRFHRVETPDLKPADIFRESIVLDKGHRRGPQTIVAFVCPHCGKTHRLGLYVDPLVLACVGCGEKTVLDRLNVSEMVLLPDEPRSSSA